MNNVLDIISPKVRRMLFIDTWVRTLDYISPQFDPVSSRVCLQTNTSQMKWFPLNRDAVSRVWSHLCPWERRFGVELILQSRGNGGHLSGLLVCSSQGLLLDIRYRRRAKIILITGMWPGTADSIIARVSAVILVKQGQRWTKHHHVALWCPGHLNNSALTI